MMTPERWASLVKHVRERVEDHYWGLMDSLNTTVFVSSPSVSVGNPMMILMRSPVVSQTLPLTLTMMVLWLMMIFSSFFI